MIKNKTVIILVLGLLCNMHAALQASMGYPTLLYVVCHGPTATLDFEGVLSIGGQAEAQAMADRIANFNIETLYASSKPATQEMAAILAARLDDKPVVVDVALDPQGGSESLEEYAARIKAFFKDKAASGTGFVFIVGHTDLIANMCHSLQVDPALDPLVDGVIPTHQIYAFIYHPVADRVFYLGTVAE